MIGRHRNKKTSAGLEENWMSYISEREKNSHQEDNTYKNLFKNAPIGLISIDQDGTIIDCNDYFVNRVGSPKEEICGSNILKIPNRELAMAVKGALEGGITQFKGEYEFVTTRQRLSLEADFAPNCNESRKNTGVIGVVSDASNQEQLLSEALKRSEERFRFITEHDPLTGLYNRINYEKDLQIIDDQGQCPMAIIIADLDGLKLVNDTLGVSVGDKFLLACSHLLLALDLKDAKIYRIGGDEFAVLLADYEHHQVDGVYQQLKSAIDKFNVGNNSIPLSISMGYAVRNDSSISMAEVVKEADQNMCRQKLFHQQSGRSAIVDIIMKALEERDLITEAHTGRMQDLVIMLADSCGFNENEKQALCLLARFHDIGKVGIPDHILFKTGKLSSDEYEEMKKHSEIGFRIARSAADLAYIAEWILKHHERWDGRGYPIGLKGEEIPRECRILAIVDAYDAMISDRPYRKALPKAYAIEELIRGAGTQFDPAMVEVFLQALKGIEHGTVLQFGSASNK